MYKIYLQQYLTPDKNIRPNKKPIYFHSFISIIFTQIQGKAVFDQSSLYCLFIFAIHYILPYYCTVHTFVIAVQTFS